MITGDRLIGRTAVLALLYVVFMCAAPTVTQAQFAGGNITGIARGDSDSPMPGLQVSMKDVTTGQVRTALTDTSGSYSLPALPVGNYELTVSAPGFVTQVWAGITVAVGIQRVLDFVMRLGNSEALVGQATERRADRGIEGSVHNGILTGDTLRTVSPKFVERLANCDLTCGEGGIEPKP